LTRARLALWLVVMASAPAGGASGCVIDELREDDVGSAPLCEAAQAWPTGYAELEDELFDEIGDLREIGGMCDGDARNPVARLDASPELRCAARIHATDLAANVGGLQHDGSDGSSPLSRANLAGYPGLVRHELLAADYVDAPSVVAAWLASTAHCNALYDKGIAEGAIGHSRDADGGRIAWVLLTGELRP
jgi:uncharacterized protein YkwD